MPVLNILKAVSVRLVLLLHTLIAVWRVSEVYGEIYYLLFLAVLPFILEGLYTVIKRNGIEWKWICPCFVLYLLATLPSIWLLELNRTKTFGAINTTAVNDIVISGVTIPLRLPADTWVLVIEESLLYLMILGRWLLPRGRVSRAQLSELLFTFIGIASDIMELFALFDEEQVRGSLIFTYALLGVWSWSLLQFTMVLTVAAKPIRINLIQQDNSMVCIEPEKKKRLASFEVLATMVSLFMQDGPFLVLRLYTIIEFNLVNYSLIFFTTKNVLVILLLLYRLFVKCSNKFCPEQGDEDGDKNENYYVKQLAKYNLTREDVIAAFMKKSNPVRNRKSKTKSEKDNMTRYDGRSEEVVTGYGARSDITVETIVPEDLPYEACVGLDIVDDPGAVETKIDSEEPPVSKSNGSIADRNGKTPKKVVLVLDHDKSEVNTDTDPQTPSPIQELENAFKEDHNTAM